MEFSEFKLWSEDQLLESININEVKDFVLMVCLNRTLQWFEQI